MENSPKWHNQESHKAASKDWNFPSVNGELTIGQLWEDNKMDEICTIDALWETVEDSEMKGTPSPGDEETWTTSHDPRKSRQSKTKEHFLRDLPTDVITHHNEKKIWYLLEFKRTSDIRPDYLERKEDMTRKQYENFMDILRSPPESEKKIKDTTTQTNIYCLFNILKSYYVYHCDIDKLQLSLDTRQPLDKHPGYEDRVHEETHKDTEYIFSLERVCVEYSSYILSVWNLVPVLVSARSPERSNRWRTGPGSDLRPDRGRTWNRWSVVSCFPYPWMGTCTVDNNA
jgi:hypothetical protein